MGYDAGTVEGVIGPEFRGKWVMLRYGDDPVPEVVTGREPQDAHGFDAYVLICGSVHDRGTRLIGNGARKDLRRAAAGVSNAHEWYFNLLERPVVIEIEVCKLRHAQFIVNVYLRVDFFAAVPINLETHVRFEQLDLRGKFRSLGGSWYFFSWRLLRAAKTRNDGHDEQNSDGMAPHGASVGPR